jgi:hypothetical protein
MAMSASKKIREPLNIRSSSWNRQTTSKTGRILSDTDAAGDVSVDMPSYTVLSAQVRKILAHHAGGMMGN